MNINYTGHESGWDNSIEDTLSVCIFNLNKLQKRILDKSQYLFIKTKLWEKILQEANSKNKQKRVSWITCRSFITSFRSIVLWPLPWQNNFFSLYHLKDPRDIKRLSFLQLFPEFSPSYRNGEKKQTDSENSIHAIDDMKSDRFSHSDKVTDLSRPFLFPQSRQL